MEDVVKARTRGFISRKMAQTSPSTCGGPGGLVGISAGLKGVLVGLGLLTWLSRMRGGWGLLVSGGLGAFLIGCL